VVARWADGAPAAVASSFGRGRTLMLGSYLGAAFEGQKDPALQRFFTALLEWAGVERAFEVAGGTVELRLLESAREKLLFIFNHEKQPQIPRIRLRTPAGEYAVTDLATGEPVAAAREAGWLSVQTPLPSEGVRVLRLTAR